MKISNIITENQANELIKESSSTEIHDITLSDEKDTDLEDFDFEIE